MHGVVLLVTGTVILNLQMGVYFAVPWAGFFSLGLALVTPFQGAIGVAADFFTSKKFNMRVKEVIVPPFLRKMLSKKFPILGQPSFVVKFGPVGVRLRNLSFYASMINGESPAARPPVGGSAHTVHVHSSVCWFGLHARKKIIAENALIVPSQASSAGAWLRSRGSPLICTRFRSRHSGRR